MSQIPSEPRLLRPLPAPLRGIACAHCAKTQSSWWAEGTGEEEKVYTCALCFLYRSAWSLNNRAPIEEVVLQVEKSRSVPFTRNAKNQLTAARDADDVLGVIVLASRVAGVQKMAERWK